MGKMEKNSHILDEREVEVKIWRRRVIWDICGHPLQQRGSLQNKPTFIFWRKNLTPRSKKEDLFKSVTKFKIFGTSLDTTEEVDIISFVLEKATEKKNHHHCRKRQKRGPLT